MKKIFLLILFGYSSFLDAQTCQGPVLFGESFESDTLPNGWTVLDLDGHTLYYSMPAKGYTGAWQAYNHYGRKCATCCDFFSSVGAAKDYLITPAITLGSGVNCLSWKGARIFNEPGFADEKYDVMISTTTPTVDGLEANPKLLTITEHEETWVDHSVDLSAYAGQMVYLGFYLETSAGYGLNLDDIRVSTPVSMDVAVTSFQIPDVIRPNSAVAIQGTLVNGGLDDVTSLNLNWSVNNGNVTTQEFSGITIPSQTYFDFNFDQSWIPSNEGTYYLRVWADSLNGGTDDYAPNDTFTQVIFVSDLDQQIMVEEFTQASCGPCAEQNPDFDDLLYENLAVGKVNALKYHTDWPGVDPMNDFNEAEVEDRVSYYGISYVPEATVNGRFIPACETYWTGSPHCLDQNYIDSLYNDPSIFKIGIQTSLNGSTYSIKEVITTETDFPLTSFTIYTAAFEDTITYADPPGWTEEKVFPQVMRKMLPDDKGVPLSSMYAGQTLVFNFDYDLDLNVIDTSHLQTLVFIQSEVNKKIYQSARTSTATQTSIDQPSSDEYFSVFPNPTNDVVKIVANGNASQERSFLLENSMGERIFSGTMNNERVLDLTQLPGGIYLLVVENNGKKLMRKLVKE